MIQVRDRRTGWWFTLPEPRLILVVHMGVYTVFLLCGLVAFQSPPEWMRGSLSHVAMRYWGVLLVLCGVLGASSVLRGHWAVERMGIVSGISGVLMFQAVIIDLAIKYGGGAAFLGIPAVLLLGGLEGHMLIRLLRIRRYRFDPDMLPRPD